MHTKSTLLKDLHKAINTTEFKDLNSIFQNAFTNKNTLDSLFAAVNNNSIITETLSKTEEDSVTKLLTMFSQEQVAILGIKVHKLYITIE